MKTNKLSCLITRFLPGVAVLSFLILVPVSLWALINPHYTPVDLYYQSQLILRVEVGPPDSEGAMPLSVIKSIKGKAPADLSLKADRIDEALMKNLKQALGARKRTPALMFAGDFSEAEMDESPAGGSGPVGMMAVGTSWFALKDMGGHLLVAEDPLAMHTVWAGSDKMLERLLEYVKADARADVPVKARVTWGGELKLTGSGSPVNGCIAVDVFGDKRPCLFLSSGSADRLYRPGDGEGELHDVTEAVGLRTHSKCAVWGDFNRDGKLDLASASEGRLSLYMMNPEEKLGEAAEKVELPAACVSLSLLSPAGKGPVSIAVGTEHEPVVVTAKMEGGMAAEVLPLPQNASGGRAGPCAVADFDGDAVPDIVQPRSENLLFFKGKGQASFATADVASEFRFGEGLTFVLCGDYDADGLLDLLAGGVRGCRLLSNLGGGKFGEKLLEAGAVSYNVGQSELTGGANCDVNNDGRQEFVLFCKSTWFRPFFNRGFRCFGYAIGLDPERSGLEGARACREGQQAGAAADFNGDGAQDLAVVTASGEVRVLFRKAGRSPRLAVKVALPAGCASPRNVICYNGVRCLGARVIRSGSCAFFGRRNPGPLKLMWKTKSGSRISKTVKLLKPAHFELRNDG